MFQMSTSGVHFRCKVHLQFDEILPLSEEAHLSVLTDGSTTSYAETSQNVSQGTCELQLNTVTFMNVTELPSH